MSVPHSRLGDGSDDFSVANPDGVTQLGARFDSNGRRRQGVQPTAPTVAIGAGASAGGGSPSVTSHTGTDEHGNITLHTGTTPVAGVAATLTFATPYTGTNPPIVQIEPKDSGASALYFATCTNTVLTISTVNALGSGVSASFDYYVTCGA
jgi:hypothetical protein